MRLRRFLLACVGLAALAALGSAYAWLKRPLALASDVVEVSIEPGRTPHATHSQVVKQRQFELELCK